jgi:hypothetical protein
MEGCNRSANAVDKMERSAIAGAMSKDKLWWKLYSFGRWQFAIHDRHHNFYICYVGVKPKSRGLTPRPSHQQTGHLVSKFVAISVRYARITLLNINNTVPWS